MRDPAKGETTAGQGRNAYMVGVLLEPPTVTVIYESCNWLFQWDY